MKRASHGRSLPYQHSDLVRPQIQQRGISVSVRPMVAPLSRAFSTSNTGRGEVYKARVPSLTRVAPLPHVTRGCLTNGAAFLRMALLRSELQRANDSYHNLGKAVMPDSKYDILLDELQQLEQTYPQQVIYLDKGAISDAETEMEMAREIQLYHTDTRVYTIESILRGSVPSPTKTVGALPLSLRASTRRRQQSISFTPKEYEEWLRAQASDRQHQHQQDEQSRRVIQNVVSKLQSGGRNTRTAVVNSEHSVSGQTEEISSPQISPPRTQLKTTAAGRSASFKKPSSLADSRHGRASGASSSQESPISSKSKTVQPHKRRLMSINSLFDPKDLNNFFKGCNTAQQTLASRITPAFQRTLTGLYEDEQPQDSHHAHSSLANVRFPNESMLFASIIFDPRINPESDPLRKAFLQHYTLKARSPTTPIRYTPTTIAVEHKYDGIAVSLEYEKAALSTALTRGDGTEGNIVNDVMNTYTDVPTTIDIQRLQMDTVMWFMEMSICTLGLLVDDVRHDDGDDAHRAAHGEGTPTAHQRPSTIDEWNHVVQQLHDYVILHRGNTSTHHIPPYNHADTILSFVTQYLEHIPSTFLRNISNQFPILLSTASEVVSRHLPSLMHGNINVRGECILPQAIYRSCPEFQSYSTARHFVSGVYNRIDDAVKQPLDVVQSDGTRMPRKGVVDFLGYALYCDDDYHDDPSALVSTFIYDLRDKDTPLGLEKLPLGLLIPHSTRLEWVKRQSFTTYGIAAEIPIDSETTATSTHNPIIIADHTSQYSDTATTIVTAPATDQTPPQQKTTHLNTKKEKPAAEPIPPSALDAMDISPAVASPHDVILSFQGNRVAFPYDCDGLVFKIDSTIVQEAMGHTAHHPRWSIAPKYQGDTKTTILKDIAIQVGKSGRVVPVAILEAVNVEGSYINKVVLHNHAFLSSPLFSNLRIGDEVSVEKRGGAIPLISGKGTKTYLDAIKEQPKLRQHPDHPLYDTDVTNLTLSHANQLVDAHKTCEAKGTINANTNTAAASTPVDIPESSQWLKNIGKRLDDILPQDKNGKYVCPCAYQTELSQIQNSTGSTSVSFYCTAEHCPEKKLYTLEHYCSKKGIDIDAVSSQTLQKLLDLGVISSDISSIPRLVYNEYYRASLYALAGIMVIPSTMNGTESPPVNKKAAKDKLKLHKTPFDHLTKLYDDDINYNATIVHASQHPSQDGNTQLVLPPIEPGFKLKKVENILSAIHETHQNLTLDRVLLGYGLTKTHISTLQQITDDPAVMIGLTVDDILQRTETRAATARDMIQKIELAKPDLIRSSRYIPCLASLQQFDHANCIQG